MDEAAAPWDAAPLHPDATAPPDSRHSGPGAAEGPRAPDAVARLWAEAADEKAQQPGARARFTAGYHCGMAKGIEHALVALGHEKPRP